jgi:cytochrome c5
MRTLLPLAVILLAAGGVTYVMMASRGREPPENSNSAGAHAPGSPVVSITLPYDEPVLPPGPHQREFQIACTTCHSTRLAMTQPPFPKAKWEATVKKMVDAFGAPLTREEQARAVEYLMSVRGK